MNAPQIAYSPDDAWRVVGLKSKFLLNAAVARGDITPRYFSPKTPVFLHEDLLELVKHLSVDKASA